MMMMTMTMTMTMTMIMRMIIKIGKDKNEQFKTCKSTLYKKEFVVLTNQTKTRMKTVRMARLIIKS